jgi:hypothetical protein
MISTFEKFEILSQNHLINLNLFVTKESYYKYYRKYCNQTNIQSQLCQRQKIIFYNDKLK